MAAEPVRDTNPRGGDAAARNRRIRNAFASATVARLISVTVRLFQIPIALAYLGDERYGIWVTLFAFLTMAAFTDLGVSNGLINLLSGSFAKGDYKRASAAVSNALLMTGALSVLIGAALIGVSFFISWGDILNSSDSSIPSAVTVLGAMYVISTPLTVFRRTLVGFQRTDLMHRADVAVAIAALVLLVGAVQLELPTAVIMALLATPRLGAAAANMIQVRRHFPLLRPSWRAADRAVAAALLRTGFLFFMLSISGAVSFQSDFVVLSRILGPEATTSYSVPFQVYMFVPQFATLAFLALWPAYGEAAASGDTDWVLRAWRRSTITVTALNMALAAFLLLASPLIVSVWTNESLAPDLGMRVALGLWIIVLGAGTSTHTLMNGLNVIGFQVVNALTMAAANILLSIFLVHQVGPEGVAYGSAIAYTSFVLVPQLAYFALKHPEILRRPSSAHAHTEPPMGGGP